MVEVSKENDSKITIHISEFSSIDNRLDSTGSERTSSEIEKRH
jgi:hypothetical protein